MVHTTPRRRPKRAYFRSLVDIPLLLEQLEPRQLFSAAPPSAAADAVAQANNAFAFDLFQELNKTNAGNMFFSPYSVATALEMTLQGAQGVTAAEMIQTLHLPSADIAQAGIAALYQLFQADPTTAGYTLSTANRLWTSDNFPLLQSFIDASQNLFGASPQSVDFTHPDDAAATINAWVSAQTNGKIPNLITPQMLNSFTALVLTNAIYFKGDWSQAFDPYGTRDASFTLPDGTSETVNMMHASAYYDYASQSGTNGYQALDLGYQGDNLDMLVILPNGSLDNFQSSFDQNAYDQITSSLHGGNTVDVSLPKFSLGTSYDLVQPLKDLGMESAFGNADFNGMFPFDPNVSYNISDVIHKAYIKVDEKGTEAAAATGIVMVRITAVRADPPPPIVFDADHPFLFLIRDRATNTILFMGRVTDPGYDPNGNSPAPPPGYAPPGLLGGGGFVGTAPIYIVFPSQPDPPPSDSAPQNPVAPAPSDPSAPTAPIASPTLTPTTPTPPQQPAAPSNADTTQSSLASDLLLLTAAPAIAATVPQNTPQPPTDATPTVQAAVQITAATATPADPAPASTAPATRFTVSTLPADPAGTSTDASTEPSLLAQLQDDLVSLFL